MDFHGFSIDFSEYLVFVLFFFFFFLLKMLLRETLQPKEENLLYEPVALPAMSGIAGIQGNARAGGGNLVHALIQCLVCQSPGEIRVV